jgi:cyanophycin synthetase
MDTEPDALVGDVRPSFEVRDLRVLHTGNSFRACPVIRATIAGAAGIDWASIEARVRTLIRELLESEDSLPTGRAVGTGEATAPDAAQVFSRAALDLQRLAGAAVSWSAVAATGQEGLSIAVCECQSQEPGLAAAEALALLFRFALGAEDPLLLSEARSLCSKVSAHAKTRKIVMALGAAERLQIPWSFVAPTAYPTIALGQGRKRRLFWRHMTGETSHIGVVLSSSKQLANRTLLQSGLPVPAQRVVSELSDAIDAARSIGWPVVTKPANTDFGTAVTTRIMDEETLGIGFKEASAHGNVLIEKHIEGDNYRLLVWRGECISVVRQTPARVIGDGVKTVSQLVEATNSSRSEVLSSDWKKIEIDDGAQDVLRRQNLSLDSIPRSGQVAFLRFHTNLSVGGTMENVTDTTHPDIKRLAVTAAAILGIDLAGVDFITTDGSRSYHEVGGGIAEINVNPGFIMGEPENRLEDKIFGDLFPEPDRGRIPIVGVMHEKVQGQLCRLIGEVIENSDSPVAVATEKAVTVGSARIASGELPTWRRTAIALADPEAAAAVVTVRPRAFEAQGLGVDRISLAVAVPPWEEATHLSFVGFAALADGVILPSEWLSSYLERARGSANIWALDSPSAPTHAGRSVNRVSWIEAEAAIRIDLAEGATVQVTPPAPIAREKRYLSQVLAAVATAFKVPTDRLNRVLGRLG